MANLGIPTSYSALVVPVEEPSDPLTVSKFIPGQKPGNVAICISGGGSRAMTAAMGQLNALEAISYAPGQSLLSQVKALSTVSGGSWLGVPFVYLPSSVSDQDYLGGSYVQPGALTRADLGSLPAGCIAANVTSDFTLLDMMVQALILSLDGAPPDMLWQTIIGLHFLAPYGLFSYTQSADTPNSFFSYNQTTLDAILTANPPLEKEQANLVSAQPRPYLVCNTAMFVTANNEALLAPVQATSFFTGIVSMPPGAIDADGLPVGGGGVTSFAFSSTPTAYKPSTVTVTQKRQWALVDAVGSSSAAFAATLKDMASMFAKHPDLLAHVVRERKTAAENFMKRNGVQLSTGQPAVERVLLAHSTGDSEPLTDAISALSDLIPSYSYWPVAKPPVGSTINPTQFADGGSLENSGIAAMLAYKDVQTIIVFTNTSTAISSDHSGNIIVDDSLPPLFGYHPYVMGVGYAVESSRSSLLKNNQVFRSSEFQSLLDNLWLASGKGSYQSTPLYLQKLTTVENSWFGVEADRQVTILWVYLERVKAWYDQLSHDVKCELGPFHAMRNDFPHYSTIFSTQLTHTEINLLANLTGWMVRNSQSQFEELFAS